ncbi:GntR family transcriptional regulator [Actinomadura citrea]|uniref:DNA-binding GntR family transcriptional regulator n=1 Tax=Actinomadura citrea TaxID=46158 RepID=A0A7Y9GFT0_9ACTN|nr:GntR family transcriptional regulator [Actinomadura citrea]NYE15677.1 DNA-binding GntR family transcriptional regulator [Actinomadura citrea]GGT66489.1 GntR family transcriptional regulator [Actinomadura citrea]
MPVPAQGSWLAGIAAARHDLDRTSTAARIAGLLREQITDGRLAPGERVREEELGEALKVSRNTVREAFRLLAQERLLVHEFNRGVFVRRVTADGLADLYRVRRILECEGVRCAREAPAGSFGRVEAAVLDGERAAAAGRWPDVGTADIRFHQAIAALVGSPRVDEMIQHLLAEMRLVFHEMGSPRKFHEPYLARNRRIHDLMAGGDLAGAERELRSYLDDAEKQLTNAYRAEAP